MSEVENDIVVQHHREEVMGTIVTFDLYLASREDAARTSNALRRAIDSLHDAERVFSTWNSESPLSRLRRGEISMDDVPEEVGTVLDACRHARQLSRGWFDPWALSGGVDPTGYVKGWAAQRALECLGDLPMVGAMVNAAGDIASFGHPRMGFPFRVGVVRPDAKGDLACVINAPSAVATSGTYERGAHLINPFTRTNHTAVASASVTGRDLGLADALATALVLGGHEVLDVIENLEEYEGLVIAHDRTMTWTTRFPFAEPVPVSRSRP